MKVSELEDEKLDYWVAKASEDLPSWFTHEQIDAIARAKKYSSDWAQGGPIIEQEAGTFGIASNDQSFEQVSYWCEMGRTITRYRMSGPTHLIAAMRAYVASKFGAEVDDS